MQLRLRVAEPKEWPQQWGSRDGAPPPRRRAPVRQIVNNTDVVVGDLMLLDTGDKLIADGVMVDGHHLVRAHVHRASSVAARAHCAAQMS